MDIKKTIYFNIDMEKTGRKLQSVIDEAGYEVKEIQEYLHLACPQPVYRWFKGKMLPTVDHLYMLSILLGVHMEELLVARTAESKITADFEENRHYLQRFKAYRQQFCVI